MNKHVFLTTSFLVFVASCIMLFFLTRNNGSAMADMHSIMDSDILEDLQCFSNCMQRCVVEQIPEYSDAQKMTCEQSCGMECSNDEPVFRF